MPEPAEYLNWLNRVIQGGERGIPITEMGKSIGRAAGRLLGPGMVGGAQLPGLRTMAPWLLRLGMAHPLGAIAAAASIPTYGRFRKQIDPLWAWTGLEPDPWGMGDPSERGIAQLDPYAAGILEKAKIKPAGAPTVTPQTPQQAVQDYLTRQKIDKELAEGAGKLDRFIRLEKISGFLVPVYLDANGKEYMDWAGAKLEQQAGTELEREKFEQTKAYQAEQQRQAKEEAEATRSWRQQQLAEQKAQSEQEWGMRWKLQAAQLESERQQRLAQLRANPASWLEYASLAGTTPGLQPWMMPLMPPGYGGAQVGGALPGWPTGAWRTPTTPTGETALNPEQEWERQRMLLQRENQALALTNLPALTQPSRQYQARMGPTAMAQYGGYEQARTGITPEELQFRLWSQAPPSGRAGGLNWMR